MWVHWIKWMTLLQFWLSLRDPIFCLIVNPPALCDVSVFSPWNWQPLGQKAFERHHTVCTINWNCCQLCCWLKVTNRLCGDYQEIWNDSGTWLSCGATIFTATAELYLSTNVCITTKLVGERLACSCCSPELLLDEGSFW